MLSTISVLLHRLRSALLPLAAAAALVSGASAAQAASDGYIFTNINGAQTQIDGAPHSSQFTISATAPVVLKGGDFTMKAGSASTASVTLTLYELASNGTKTPITSKSYANGTAFCAAHGGNCTQFAPMFFDFPAPVTLQPGTTYFAELTSPAADRQSEAYFIKGGSTACFVATAAGTLISGTSCAIGQINPTPAPLLAVSKSGPATIDPGVSTAVAYDLTVTNTGTGAAAAAQVKDQLPAGLTYASFSGAGWSCSDSSGLVTCNYSGSLAVNGSSTVTINATIGATGTSIENVASVGQTGGAAKAPNSCTADDFSSGVCDNYTSTVTVSGPYLAIDLGDPTPDPIPGEPTTYEVTVTNDGNDPADGPVHTYFDIPDHTTFVSAGDDDWDCTAVGSPATSVDCVYDGNSDYPPGAETSFPVEVEVDGDTGTDDITAEAYVNRDGTDSPTPPPVCTSTDTYDCASVSTAATAHFTMSKSAPSPALKLGQQSTYQLTVTTDGINVPAEVKDQLPANLSYVAASGTGWTCGIDGSKLVTCTKSITKNTTEVVSVTVTPEADTAGQEAINYASSGPAGEAPQPGESCSGANCDSDTSVINAAGFTVDKSGPVPALKVGQASAYTLTVTSEGANVPAEVKDQLPAGLTFVSASGNGWQCGVDASNLVTCSKSISAGANEQVVVTVIPQASTAGQSVTNYASSGPAGAAPAPGPGCTTPNCDQNSAEVNASGFTVSKSAPAPGLQVGQQSVYTLTVTTDSTNVAAEVKDQLPAGLAFVSASGNGWSCSVDDDNLVTCNKTISSGNSEKIEVTVRTDASAVGKDITNYASAGPEGAAPEPGPSCGNADCDSSSGKVAPATFSLTKSAPVPGLEVNRNSTYTLTVTTDGTDVPAEVKDQLPSGLAFVSASGTGWSCAVSGSNLVTCNKTISSDAAEVIQVTVTTQAAANNQNITNYASAGLDGAAPQPGPSCKADGCASSAAKVADIREEIKNAVEDDVQAYLAARLDQLVGSFDSQSRLSRFRDTACGTSHDLSLNGAGTSREQAMAASGTFSMKGGIVPTADVPDQCNSRSNVWAQLDIGYVDGLQDSSATGGLITVGAEYLITDNFLAGVRLSMDYTDASFDSEANSDISGYGWLAGPYLSAEIANNVYLDGFIGYGTSWNDYSGNYQDLDLSGDFTTQRVAGYLNLSGNYQTGEVLLTPLLGVSFGKEWSDSFDVHNAIVGDTGIDSQDAGLGRLKGRVEAGYLVTDEVDEQLELFLAPQVTYDFLRNDGPNGDLLLGDSLWRGGVEGGFRYAHDSFGASLLVGYDGVGVSDWNAYHGQLQLNYTW